MFYFKKHEFFCNQYNYVLTLQNVIGGIKNRSINLLNNTPLTFQFFIIPITRHSLTHQTIFFSAGYNYFRVISFGLDIKKYFVCIFLI